MIKKKALKPPGPQIGANGENGKTDNCDKNGKLVGTQRGAARAPVASLIYFAALLVIPFCRFCRHLPILPFAPFIGAAVFTILMILRPPRPQLE